MPLYSNTYNNDIKGCRFKSVWIFIAISVRTFIINNKTNCPLALLKTSQGIIFQIILKTLEFCKNLVPITNRINNVDETTYVSVGFDRHNSLK